MGIHLGMKPHFPEKNASKIFEANLVPRRIPCGEQMLNR